MTCDKTENLCADCPNREGGMEVEDENAFDLSPEMAFKIGFILVIGALASAIASLSIPAGVGFLAGTFTGMLGVGIWMVVR